MRWPILLGFLVIALIVFFVGLVFNFGYSGTTPIRQMSLNDDSLYGDKKYSDAFFKLFQQKQEKGSPYIDLEGKITERYPAAPSAKNILNLDKRLVRELIYLAKGNEGNKKCGWNGLQNSQHDRIVLKTDNTSRDNNNPQGTDLTHPDANLQSNSTLKRGVGARITEADYIKCSYEQLPPQQPTNSCDGRWYVHSRYALKLNPIGGGYRWDSTFQRKINPSCIKQVKCAVDFFPNPGPVEIVDAPPDEKLPLSELTPSKYDSDALRAKSTVLNPEVFDAPPGMPPLDLSSEHVSKSAVYKIAQLALQLLATDEKECESKIVTNPRPSEACKANAPNGNVGNCRNIPYTIIFPQWVAKEMFGSGVWTNFMRIARGEYPNANDPEYKGFPYNLQDESPTAGISYDPVLDTQGLHFNY